MTVTLFAPPSPVAVFEAALSSDCLVTAVGSAPAASLPAASLPAASFSEVSFEGRTFRPRDWCRDTLPGDESMLVRCTGPTLDVGCGPGRLTRAVALRRQVALGVDVSAGAVRLARRRGAQALRRDVFAPLPREGGWHRVLLADGNIGIGGDPVRLLRRCRDLLRPDGSVIVELDPPGSRTWAGEVRIAADGGPPSAPFRWAYVGVDQLEWLARSAGLRVVERWTEAGRWFASLR